MFSYFNKQRTTMDGTTPRSSINMSYDVRDDRRHVHHRAAVRTTTGNGTAPTSIMAYGRHPNGDVRHDRHNVHSPTDMTTTDDDDTVVLPEEEQEPHYYEEQQARRLLLANGGNNAALFTAVNANNNNQVVTQTQNSNTTTNNIHNNINTTSNNTTNTNNTTSTKTPIINTSKTNNTNNNNTSTTNTNTSTTSATTNTTTTRVDGQGMWRSWTRVYNKPESACLDLLDNCFDAAIANTTTASVGGEEGNKNGKVVMEELNLDLLSSNGNNSNSILIQNNSQYPIKNLDDVLTVYKSNKNSHNNWATEAEAQANNDDATKNNDGDIMRHAIGENGVGLKQGCATLCDCSLVLTRNFQTVEMGIIAKSLQSNEGVYLPSFTFSLPGGNMDTSSGTSSQQQQRYPEILNWLSKNPVILHCLQEEASFGQTSAYPAAVDVYRTLARLVQRLSKNSEEWKDEDHVFLLVLCNLKTKTHSNDKQHELMESVDSISPAKAFLHTIKNMLPEHYINLPKSFHFKIDDEIVNFAYWQRRLVELTRFRVPISPNIPFESLPEFNWDQLDDPYSNNKYTMSIYCGFDAQRVDRDLRSGKGTSTLYLYIYSCSAGRLIKKEIDARHLLGLSASGVDYTQGLTVLINDINGHLPLTPTKDGIAWSEQPHGDIHSQNLYAWAGAVAQFFWTYHKNSLVKGGSNKTGNRVKEILKETIRSLATTTTATTVQNDNDDTPTTTATVQTVTENNNNDLEDAELSMFHGMKWQRSQTTHGTHWIIRKHYAAGHDSFSVTKGPDTLLRLKKDPVKRNKSKKRKAVAISNTTCTDDDDDGIDDDDDNYEGIATYLREGRTTTGSSSKAQPWREVDQENIEKVTMKMLSILRDWDTDELFERPVVETLPELKDRYLEVVSKSMDFKTIEEERVHEYTSITELQQDLILICKNCIRFNGTESPYTQSAQTMLELLDDTFDNVVSGKKQKRRTKRVNYGEVVNQCYQEKYEYNKPSSAPTRTRKKKKATTKSSTSGKKNGTTTTSNAATLQKQLQTEHMKVERLRKQLAARDKQLAARGKRIMELEARLLLPPADENDDDDTSNCSRQNPQPADNDERSNHSRQNPQPDEAKSNMQQDAKDNDDTGGCQICGNDHDQDLLILCHGCNEQYHTYCLENPPVPNDKWYCDDCNALFGCK